jgi:hypothetical protein
MRSGWTEQTAKRPEEDLKVPKALPKAVNARAAPMPRYEYNGAIGAQPLGNGVGVGPPIEKWKN